MFFAPKYFSVNAKYNISGISRSLPQLQNNNLWFLVAATAATVTTTAAAAAGLNWLNSGFNFFYKKQKSVFLVNCYPVLMLGPTVAANATVADGHLSNQSIASLATSCCCC